MITLWAVYTVADVPALVALFSLYTDAETFVQFSMQFCTISEQVVELK